MPALVRYFAELREATGLEEEHVDVGSGLELGLLLEEVLQRHPALRARRDSLLVAVNREFATRRRPVREGDEVAVFPPVSGG